MFPWPSSLIFVLLFLPVFMQCTLLSSPKSTLINIAKLVKWLHVQVVYELLEWRTLHPVLFQELYKTTMRREYFFDLSVERLVNGLSFVSRCSPIDWYKKIEKFSTYLSTRKRWHGNDNGLYQTYLSILLYVPDVIAMHFVEWISISHDKTLSSI